MFSRLASFLVDYDPAKKRYLEEGFSHGFSLLFKGAPFSSFSANHSSALQNPHVLFNMIQEELSLGRIAGPFSTPPADPFVVSPLGLVPKKDTGKFRVIHDLSFPRHCAVNDFITDADATVVYQSFDIIVGHVQRSGAGALIAKADIESAFRIIPVRPRDRFLLGFTINGQYYFDRCLPMGCRSSCAIFECFSNALQWIAVNKLGIRLMSHILDDFIFVGPAGSTITRKSLDSFINLCSFSGIPIKHSKTIYPSTCVTVHGIELDTVRMQARLPQDKLNKARQLVNDFRAKRRVTLKELQSLLGFLNFACKVVRPGRPFLRRLINLTKGVPFSHYHVYLSTQSRADLDAWSRFLTSFNGISIFPDVGTINSDFLKMFTDAAGSTGFAGVFGSKWFAHAWPSGWENVHITTKEMFPIIIILELWGSCFANRKVLFFTDNAAVADIINKQTCKEERTMELVRRLVLASLTHNVLFRARHISGASNVVADHLSRFSFQTARQIAPFLDAQPTAIPSCLMTTSWTPQPAT